MLADGLIDELNLFLDPLAGEPRCHGRHIDRPAE